MPLDEVEDFSADHRIGPNVAVFSEPPFEGSGFGTLRGDNANRDLGGAGVVRTVECHRRDWISPEAPTRLLFER